MENRSREELARQIDLLQKRILEIERSDTERKSAEEALKKSEEQLSAVVQNMQEGILIADEETKKFVETNNLMLEWLGYSNDEIRDMTVIDIHRKEDLPDILGLFEKMRRKEIRSAEDIPVKRKDGSVFYADVSAVNIEIAGRAYLVGFFRDITEHKKAEELKDRFFRVFESTPDFVGFADARDKYISYINMGGRKMLGIGKDEDVSKMKIAEVHPDWVNKLFSEEVFPEAMRNGAWKGECAFLHRDGHEIPVSMVLSAHKNASGEVEMFSTISRDITEIRAAEEALRDSEEKYRILYESSRDAIMTIDPPDWWFTSGNPATVEMFRAKDEAEFTSKAPWQLSPKYQPDGEPSSAKAKRMIDTAMERGSNFFEWTHRRLDGEDFSATVLLTRVEIKGRAFLQATVRDITESKRAEYELAKTQEELNQAKRLSEIGMLAATVAHELRNPMGVIRTANFNIKRKAQEPAIDKHVDMIEKKIIEADQIISNLLFYASVKMPHYENVKVYDVLRESIVEAKDRFKEKSVQVRERYEKLKTIIVEADPVQLREVFGNMLNNAYEAASDSKGKIDIAAGVDTKSKEIDISFKDNGPGIDPENMNRIKTPFFTTKAKGMGLGLSVCYQIIGLHGGSILIESAKGKGSNFTVTIPMKRAPANAKNGGTS